MSKVMIPEVCLLIIYFVLVLTHASFGIVIKDDPFIVEPQSINTTLNEDYVIFICIVRANVIFFTINGEKQFDGVLAGVVEEVGPGIIQRNLTTEVSKITNNTVTVCNAFNFTNPIVSQSKEAKLTIQGSLSQPSHFRVIDEDAEHILKWTAPPTLVNTLINGYFVSVNGGYNTFVKESQVVIREDFYSSYNCGGIHFKVSAYNGLNGSVAHYEVYKTRNMSLPVYCSISNNTDGSVSVDLSVNVSGLCSGERPNIIESIVNDTDDNKGTHFNITHSLMSDGDLFRINNSITLFPTNNSQYKISNKLINNKFEYQTLTGTTLYLCRLKGDFNSLKDYDEPCVQDETNHDSNDQPSNDLEKSSAGTSLFSSKIAFLLGTAASLLPHVYRRIG